MKRVHKTDDGGFRGRWWGVRRVVQLAGWVLVGLGLAKLLAVGGGHPSLSGSGAEAASVSTRWAVVQGVGEIGAGAAAVWLPAPMNCAVLAAVGSGFLVWQLLETPDAAPCPCLLGVRSWAGWVKGREREWRVTLASWFFLTGLLAWRSLPRKS